MATKELLTQLKLRKDTAANWTDKNPILGNGEMVIIETSSGEQRFKVGDGEKTFTQLPYTDENLLSKIKSYTAGDGISISNEGVISSTSGSSDDVFVVEFGDDGTTITTSFDDIKNAIQNHRILIYSNDGNATLPLLGSYNGDATTDQDEAIYLGGYEQNVYVEWLLLRAQGTTTVGQDHHQFIMPAANYLDPPDSGTAYWNATKKDWEIKDISSDSDVYMLNMISNSNANTMKITNDFNEAVVAAASGKILRLKDTNEKNEITYYNISNFSSSTNSSTNKTTAEFYVADYDVSPHSIVLNCIWDKDTLEVSCSNATSENPYGDSFFRPATSISNFIEVYSNILASNMVMKYPHLIGFADCALYDIQFLPLDTTKENSVTGNIYFTEDIADYLKGVTRGFDCQIVDDNLGYLRDWKVNKPSSITYVITCRYLLDPYDAEYQYTYDTTDTEHKMVFIGKKGSTSELCATITLGEKDTAKSIGEWVLVYPGTVTNNVTYNQALTAFNSNTPVKLRVTSTKTIGSATIPIVSEAYMTRYIAAQNALVFDYVHNATDLSVSSGGVVWTSDGTITCYTATYSFAFSSNDTSASSVQVPTTTKVQDMIDAAVSNIDTSGGGSTAGGYTIQVSNAAPATGTSNKIITYVVEGA